jgi:ABC-type glycerol-3-phosphate transport system permease component
MPWLEMVHRRPVQAVREAVTYILLVSGAAVFLLPLFWMVTTALKRKDELYVFPPQFFPQSFNWQNFPIAFRQNVGRDCI